MNIIYEPDPQVAYWLTLVVTVLLPLVVAAVTKASSPAWLKAVILLFLSLLTSVISNLLAVDGAENVGPMITDAVVTFIVAVASYFGLWRTDPAGVTSGLRRIGPSDSGTHQQAA